MLPVKRRYQKCNATAVCLRNLHFVYYNNYASILGTSNDINVYFLLAGMTQDEVGVKKATLPLKQ